MNAVPESHLDLLQRPLFAARDRSMLSNGDVRFTGSYLGAA
jgi:hypothetical protein